MASTLIFCEDNGLQSGNPPRGSTRTLNRTDCNWKNIDDSTSNYGDFPVRADYPSFPKYQSCYFSGAWNSLSNVRFGHTSGVPGNGLTLYAKITSGYATPTTGLISLPINVTTPSGLSETYQPVLLGYGGPEQAGLSSVTGNAYSQYIVTQLATDANNVAAGNTALIRLSVSWDES